MVVRVPGDVDVAAQARGTGASGAACVVAGCVVGADRGGRAATGHADAAETAEMARRRRRWGRPSAWRSPRGRTPRPRSACVARPAPLRPPSRGRAGRARRFTWNAIAATAGIVFVLALLFITAVELISGKPLSDIFGNAGSGTTFGTSSPTSPADPQTTTSTTTTTPASSSTSTTTTTTAHHHHHAVGGRRPPRRRPAPRPRRPPRRPARSGDDDDDACRRRDGAGYQPLNSAGRRSTKLAMPSWESSVFVTSSWPIASS